MIALSAVQSSVRTYFHNAICSQTPPTMQNTSYIILLIGMPYLLIIASKVVGPRVVLKMRAPLSLFFLISCFFGKKITKTIRWCPYLWGWHLHDWEILHPPLETNVFSSSSSLSVKSEKSPEFWSKKAKVTTKVTPYEPPKINKWKTILDTTKLVPSFRSIMWLFYDQINLVTVMVSAFWNYLGVDLLISVVFIDWIAYCLLAQCNVVNLSWLSH